MPQLNRKGRNAGNKAETVLRIDNTTHTVKTFERPGQRLCS